MKGRFKGGLVGPGNKVKLIRGAFNRPYKFEECRDGVYELLWQTDKRCCINKISYRSPL